MKFHQIEVDDEVFGYLKKKAEPLVDTPNSVLRRELPLKDQVIVRASSVPRSSNGVSSNLPPGTPAALRQILAVARLVVKGTHTRTDATRLVAQEYQVAPQTVLDKYCRQLGLTASEFDRLLEQPGLSDLKALLTKKFGHLGNTINQYLG